MTKFCLPMGLHWPLARCLKATLNLHGIEDTCLVLCIFNMLAQLSEHGVQELLSEVLLSSGFTWEKNVSNSLWCGPWTASVLKPLVDVMLTVMTATFSQQLTRCIAAVVRCFTDWIFATLWSGYDRPCLTGAEIETQRGVLTADSQGVRELGWGPQPLWLFSLGRIIAVNGVWHVVQTKCDLVHSQRRGEGPLGFV